MKLSDLLQETTIVRLFEDPPESDFARAQSQRNVTLSQLLDEPDETERPVVRPTERPARPATSATRPGEEAPPEGETPEERRRRVHTRIPGQVTREFDREMIQQVVNEAAILATGYKKFTARNMNELTTGISEGNYPTSNSSAPVRSIITSGSYFTYPPGPEGKRYYPIAVYSHPRGTVRSGLLNKVLIRRDDGVFFTSSETICMKWVRARNPTWEAVLQYARGMARVNTLAGTETEDYHSSEAEMRKVLSIFHRIDQADEQLTEEYNEVSEAKHYSGGKEYQTYDSWKKACKKKAGDRPIKWIGDKDIGECHVEGKSIGEWDGAVGIVY